MHLKIIKGDITTIECDAIVSSTNKRLIPGGKIDVAIHNAAGPELTKACAQLAPCEVGKCVATVGYNLPCKYVFHTVSPHVDEESSAHMLAQCYKNTINEALHKRCLSIAFPLLGAGNNGFPVRKALDVALNRFEVCRNEGVRNFTVYFVLYDEKTKALAMQLARDKHLDFDDENQLEEVLAMDKRWISLCKVNPPDRKNDIWMQRLADAVDGTLIAPVFDETKEPIFDNRRLIYLQDGPSGAENIGFWEWTERQSEPGRWQSDSYFIEDTAPIEILLFDNCLNIKELVEALKKGISVPEYLRNNVLFAVKKESGIEGVLCNLDDCDVYSGERSIIKLKSDIYTLPCYELGEDDILLWKQRRIYKHVSLKDPNKRISIYLPVETIKQLILQRMNWPVFKAQGVSKNDWQKFKQFLESIPKENLREKLAEMYHASEKEAQIYIDTFFESIEEYISAEDVDSSIIVSMLDSHTGLKQTCDRVAYEKWLAEHEAEVEQAKKEILALQAVADQELATTKQQLHDADTALAVAKDNRNALLEEIAVAQSKLDNLLVEIEKYEAIGNDALVAVRKKIADAQTDMAGFIADLSVFLPQSSVPLGSKKRESCWKYTRTIDREYSDDVVERAENWKDEVSAISQNLAHSLSVDAEFSNMLAAFLYAAHINNVPLLIAGPSGESIANALSVSLYSEGAGQLTLGDEFDYDVADSIDAYDENIVSVRNLFGKGWGDVLPQEFAKLGKQVIWTHPYVEDLTIEPKSLYNYMIPVLSECFVGSIRALDLWPGKRADSFQAFVSKKKQPVRLGAIKRLGVSKLLLAQLERVLSDTKEILDNTTKDRDVEFLFGLLPLCVLTGKIDILKDAIETEGSLSGTVRAEAARYIEEE